MIKTPFNDGIIFLLRVYSTRQWRRASAQLSVYYLFIVFGTLRTALSTLKVGKNM